MFVLVLAAGLLPRTLWSASSCDLNSDDRVDVVDVQVGLNQALGILSCSSADLSQDGQCSIVDVQRLINAALGQECVVGSGTPVSPPPSSTSPWVQSFSPVRQLYVTPGGTGSGAINSPMSLSAAMSQAQAGDLFWLRTGTYPGSYTFTRNGTSSKPIVWRAYTVGGQPERVTFDGKIRTEGKWNWFWSLEVTDPDDSTSGPGVEFFAEGSRVINSVVHDIGNNGCVHPWNTGPGQLVYGTVLLRCGMHYGNGPSAAPHPIYTQNDFTQNEYKYFVQLISLDAMDAATNSFSFHAYSSTAKVSGMWVQDSFFDRGRFVVGDESHPSSNNVVRRNYFHDMTASDVSISLGWKGPSQLEFTDNYIVKGTIVSRSQWGAGFQQASANKVTGNSVYQPLNGYHVMLTTGAMVNGSINWGSSAIRNVDIWDNNTYGGSSFKAILHAKGTKTSPLTGFDNWRNLTKNARESSNLGLDLNSSLAPNPTTNKVVLLRNEYEPGRGNLAIYNWANSSTVAVNLSSVIGVGKPFTVRDVRNFYGTPILSGTYQGGSVNIPTAGNFFPVYVVTSAP